VKFAVSLLALEFGAVSNNQIPARALPVFRQLPKADYNNFSLAFDAFPAEIANTED
jgi:hypothetical protein